MEFESIAFLSVAILLLLTLLVLAGLVLSGKAFTQLSALVTSLSAILEHLIAQNAQSMLNPPASSPAKSRSQADPPASSPASSPAPIADDRDSPTRYG